MSLKTEQPRPGAVGQPSREAVRFLRRATPARRAIAWSLVPVVCSYKINERQWESDHAENSPPHLPKSA